MPKIINQDRFEDPHVQDFKAFIQLKKQIDDLSNVQSEIKSRLIDFVENNGDTDDKGHIWYDLPEEFEGYKGMQRQRRVSQKLDMESAQEILDRLGLSDRCIKMVPSLDEDEVMACLYEGLLTEDEIDQMFPKTITWAFVPIKK